MPKVVRARRMGTPPKRLRAFKLGEGLPNLGKLCDELEAMRDVLMGREDPPVSGMMALMEVADGYYARAAEIEQLILRLEREGRVTRSHPLYRFRTGELRSFKEMCARAADLGSRRITAANIKSGQEIRGRESYRG